MADVPFPTTPLKMQSWPFTVSVRTAKANGLNVYTYLEYLFLYLPDTEWQSDLELLEDKLFTEKVKRLFSFKEAQRQAEKEAKEKARQERIKARKNKCGMER